MHATKNGDDNERKLLQNYGCCSYFNAVLQSINDHSQTVTYNREYEQRTNNIYFSILWDLEILRRSNWGSTDLTSEGLVNVLLVQT